MISQTQMLCYIWFFSISALINQSIRGFPHGWHWQGNWAALWQNVGCLTRANTDWNTHRNTNTNWNTKISIDQRPLWQNVDTGKNRNTYNELTNKLKYRRFRNSFVCMNNEKVILVFVGLQYDNTKPNHAKHYKKNTGVSLSGAIQISIVLGFAI